MLNIALNIKDIVVGVMKVRVLLVFFLSTLFACSKVDGPSNDDIDLSRLYCNDPEAVNYNWDFPGTADNNVCFYPRDVFEGTYTLTDTIFSEQYDINDIKTITIKVIARSVNDLALVGMCGNTDTLDFTADRFYKASSDTTIIQPDSIVLPGQLSCRNVDTLNGIITNINKAQGKDIKLRINFTIASDTGINFHIGTAIKQ